MTDRAYGKPTILRADGSAVPLERIELASAPTARYDEAFIQNLVFANPTCLPIDEIDQSFSPLVPVCTELSTAAGPLDALFVTPAGRLVVLEAKLWRNPDARRKVVAQILDYARELSSWDYEDLQREVSRRLKRKGNALYDLVSDVAHGVDEASFVDAVQKSLSQGRFLLLIVGDGIREGAATIASFLERYGRLDFTFGLVELELCRIGEDDVLVLPRVLARTVIVNRQIVALPEGATITDVRDEQEEEETESRVFYNRFWTDFLATLKLDDPGQPIPAPAKSTNLYFTLPPSGSTCWISLFFSRSRNQAGVFLTFAKGSYGDRAFARLQLDQEAIDKELGIAVEWRSTGEKHQVICFRSFPDVWSEAERSAIMEFFADCLNRFVNTLRPRLRRIADSDREWT